MIGNQKRRGVGRAGRSHKATIRTDFYSERNENSKITSLTQSHIVNKWQSS